ncbi:MAG TPA: L-threonylcarbamoyladenylate synthase [bacterium]|nr:L-threonylcarbamoyladenylate synthase [bacterium]
MTEILQIDPEKPDPAKIRQAVDILKKGGICAYPTETFYGLGVDVTSEPAIKRLFDVKRRDYGNPVAVIVADREMLATIVDDIPEKAKVLMDVFWPGPLTILYRTNARISRQLTTNTGKIGIRVSSHPIAAALTRELGRPLTTTSANLSGFPPSLNVRHLKSYFGGKIDAIIDSGDLMPSGGSTVVDVTEDKLAVIREGVIKADVLFRHFEEDDYEST